MSKPILCLDFDGVLHSYASGWKGADVIPDPPVEGAIEFILAALDRFEVHIFSSRTNQEGGRLAMGRWLTAAIKDHFWKLGDNQHAASYKAGLHMAAINWPTEKPPAMVTIDDRAITFTGVWPEIDELLAFQPWNKKSTFDDIVGAGMNPERAGFIRTLRVDAGATWREVALFCGNAWPEADWGSNQFAGIALCRAAAKHFGEDADQQPWN